VRKSKTFFIKIRIEFAKVTNNRIKCFERHGGKEAWGHGGKDFTPLLS
jgi:hypothetical protein